MYRGFQQKCPCCGVGQVMSSFMKVTDHCGHCATELHHHRADDLPPYLTIMIVGHIVVPLLLLVEKVWRPDLWIHAMIWLPLTLVMTLWLMPRVKGAVVGLQWALQLDGFAKESAPPPKP
jgi:uncharacterized protein (DUF983 family)